MAEAAQAVQRRWWRRSGRQAPVGPACRCLYRFNNVVNWSDLRVQRVVHAARWYSLITPPSTFRRCTGASSGTTDWLVMVGWPLVPGLVRPVPVIVADVLAQDQPQVPFSSDQHPVQALAARAGDPAFRIAVAPHRQLHPIRSIGTGASG